MKKLLMSAVLGGAFLTGCASVPMASMKEDAAAKAFTVQPGKSSIYVYRNEFLGGARAMKVSLDDKVAGETKGKTYFLWEVEPGHHTITSAAENTTNLPLDTVADKAYYVRQEVKMGLFGPRSKLYEVPAAVGQAGVKECKRAQSAF